MSAMGSITGVNLGWTPLHCLSFATLTVFLDKIYAFDFTLAKTRLSLRGTGADGQSLEAIYEMGLGHERRRTKQANAGAKAKQEANSDNEAKIAQTKGGQTTKSRFPGQGPG
jgi:hypothetical protein